MLVVEMVVLEHFWWEYSQGTLGVEGFMADSAMANWKAVYTIYGNGSTDEEMENCEKMC